MLGTWQAQWIWMAVYSCFSASKNALLDLCLREYGRGSSNVFRLVHPHSEPPFQENVGPQPYLMGKHHPTHHPFTLAHLQYPYLDIKDTICPFDCYSLNFGKKGNFWTKKVTFSFTPLECSLMGLTGSPLSATSPQFWFHVSWNIEDPTCEPNNFAWLNLKGALLGIQIELFQEPCLLMPP